MKPAVLFFTALLTATGGGQHAMSLLAQELVARGYSLELATRPPFDPTHRYAGWLAEVGVPITVWPRLAELRWVRILCGLSGLLVSIPYSLFRRCSLFKGFIAGKSIWLTRIAQRERRSIFRSLDGSLRKARAEQRSFILHIWGPAALTPLLLEWAASRAVPAIYHEMGEADAQYVETWELQPTVSALSSAEAVICCSDRVASSVKEVYRYQGPIHTVPFMVQDPGEAWTRGRKSGGRLTFGAVGRLVPHKRHASLILALKELTDEGYDAGLVIAGSGPEMEELQALTNRTGLQDRVSFTGEFEDLTAVMALFDVFTLVSSSESQCMPIVESMSYGKPSVVSDFGGMSDFVDAGKTGFLVPLDDGDALSAALRRFLDNPGLLADCETHCRDRFAANYRPEAVTAGIELVYAQVVEPRPLADLAIAYVVESYPTFIVNEINELRKQGAHIRVLNAFQPRTESDPVISELQRQSEYQSPRSWPVVRQNLMTAMRHPVRYLRELAFLAGSGESIRILLLGAYYAARLDDSDIQHVHGTFGTRTTALAYAISRFSRIGYSFTTHAYDIFTPNPSLVWKTRSARFMRTISEFNVRYLTTEYPSIDSSRIKVVRLGVDTKLFHTAAAAPAASPPLILSVGALVPKKGHQVLMAALSVLARDRVPFLCKIVGEGPMRSRLEELIRENDLGDHVQLMGNQPSSEVRRLLGEASVFALACVDSRAIGEHLDGIPVALMEAMATGLPVVTTTVSGVPELVQDAATGLLVSPDNPVSLAEAIRSLLQDPAARSRLGTGARAKILKDYALEENALELGRLFRSDGIAA